MIPWLRRGDPFPPLALALAEPNGLLAAGGDLGVPRLLAAYQRGIFPWFSPGEPILWWSPDPRMVLFPEEFRVSRSLRKRIVRGDYQITSDTAFAQVMAECAAPRGDERGTWISPAMVQAYCWLHEAGHAHSFEAWVQGENGVELAGGVFGVAIRRAF